MDTPQTDLDPKIVKLARAANLTMLSRSKLQREGNLQDQICQNSLIPLVVPATMHSTALIPLLGITLRKTKILPTRITKIAMEVRGNEIIPS